MDAQTVLARLREDESHVEGLVTVAVDHALTRPLAELIDPNWLAAALADGVRSVSSSVSGTRARPSSSEGSSSPRRSQSRRVDTMRAGTPSQASTSSSR